MKIKKIVKNIEPILSVTNNIIKKSNKFYEYYVKESNNLYENQIPLLYRNPNIREVMKLKKLRREDIIKDQSDYNEEENEEQNINYTINPLSNIRKPHIRSIKLPPLCPFYSQKGDLLPEVISTSKIYSHNTIKTESNYDINISISSNSLGKNTIRRRLGMLSPLTIKTINHNNYNKLLEINFDQIEKEILCEQKYDSLKYNNDDIFGHKEFYQEFINGLVEEIFILTGEDYENKNEIQNNEIKKEKIYEWGKNKRKIILTLNSLNIKIKEISENDTIENIIHKDKVKNKTCFEYNLPIYLLPLFYFKGYEKFKLFLLSFIHFDEEKQKFEINENIPKIINILLKSCKDVKIKKDNEDESENIENVLQPVDFKKNTLNSKVEKKSSKMVSILKPLAKSMNFGMALLQNQLFAGTNVDIIAKKKLKRTKFNLYPKEKKNIDYINYSNFKFFWNTSNKMFSINIEMPLITFIVPSYNIVVKEYINYELLFYLFKLNFDSWDFYVIKYLSSFKLFRILLSQLTAIKPKKNMSLYLGKYKNKYFENTDYKIINIITSDFLTENNKVKKQPKLFDFKKLKFKINKTNDNNDEKNKENIKNDINENKIEDKKEENKNIIKDEDNNEKGKEDKISQNNKKNEEQKIDRNDNMRKESINPIRTEEMRKSIQTLNTINESSLDNKNNNITDNKIQKNSILEQKCFVALVTLTNLEKTISNEYTIHFNYYQFTKFKSMEKYMKKTTFLIKFLNINYEKSTINFDYEALNDFDEMKWMNEVEKYNFNYESEFKTEDNNINKEDIKVGIPVVNINNKNKVEFNGPIKGTSIIIEIKPPLILLRTIDKDGKINTKATEVFEEEENQLIMNETNNVFDLTKNILKITQYHKQKEIEKKNNKDLADNILFYAFRKKNAK